MSGVRSCCKTAGMTTTGKTLNRAVIALAIVISAFLVVARDAEAHTVTAKQCSQYGQMHHFSTGRAALPAVRLCRKAAARHEIAHATQECYAMPSGMLRGTCAAIAWVRPAWATSSALHELLRRESSWNPNALNDSSHACGLFQRLPCPWPYDVHPEHVYATQLAQVKNGVRYIDGRYGTPENAIAFHNSHGWY